MLRSDYALYEHAYSTPSLFTVDSILVCVVFWYVLGVGMYDLGVIGGGTAVSKAAFAIERFGKVAISYIPGWAHASSERFDFVPHMEQLLKDKLVRSLYIATPVNTHFEFIELALRYNVPALVEKPVTKTLLEAVQIANRHPLKLAVALKKRYSIATRRISETRQSDPNSRCRISYTWLAPHPGPNHWKLSGDVAGGGVLMDVGSHMLDLFRFAVGPIASIEIQDSKIDELHGTESAIKLKIEFVDGSDGEIVAAWANNTPLQRIHFIQGTKEIQWTKEGENDAIHLETQNLVVNKKILDDPSSEYFQLFADFASFVDGCSSSVPNWSEGVENMRVIDSLYRQMRNT